MSVFDAIKRLFSPKQELPQWDLPVMELDEIWKIEERPDLLAAIQLRLCARSDYGEHMERLSPVEQVFYICTVLEEEVNNGGFDQFFYNSSGDHTHRAEECLRTIGAHKTAQICHTAVTAFGTELPRETNKRRKFLEKRTTDEISDILSQCDDRFYDYPDDLEELNYRYFMANRDQFS